MITLTDFTYTYPLTRKPALDGLTLSLEPGGFYALIGANGAGKSTLCYALAGFVPRFFQGVVKGSISVLGHDVTQAGPGQLADLVGLVFENPFNQVTGARFSVREEVAFGLENLGLPREEILERADAALETVGLSGLGDRSPFALSGGQAQRLAIASILAMKPPLLVLDEPTSQLDPAGTAEVFEVLSRLAADEGSTIIMASHKLEWIAQHAEQVMLLDAGRIVLNGSPHDVLTSSELLEAGLRPTRYTEAARLAREQGLIPDEGRLPVTLDEAREVFKR